MSKLNEWLRGVRVLDLSKFLPGPMAGMLLADMGAEVLKIEPPTGDEMRELGPRDELGEPIFYGAVNAGKTVRRMNLKDLEGRAEFLKLVTHADVVLETFRPGVMSKLGLGWDVLRATNPRLVYCALSGYGATGPHAPSPCPPDRHPVCRVRSIRGAIEASWYRVGWCPRCRWEVPALPL
jgi:alpha-methylacyl-CoA racemase